MIELSNPWGVRKYPCEHITLDPDGTVVVTLQLMRPVSGGTTEGITNRTLVAGEISAGSVLRVK